MITAKEMRSPRRKNAGDQISTLARPWCFSRIFEQARCAVCSHPKQNAARMKKFRGAGE